MYAPVALALERTQPATLLLRLEAPFIYDREKSEPDIGSLSACFLIGKRFSVVRQGARARRAILDINMGSEHSRRRGDLVDMIDDVLLRRFAV